MSQLQLLQAFLTVHTPEKDRAGIHVPMPWERSEDTQPETVTDEERAHLRAALAASSAFPGT